MKEKDLNISEVRGAKKNISDLQVYGDGDTFALLCKASSQEQGWMKSTKNLSKIWGIIYVKRMIPMIHNYTSNISREQFELIREDLENA
ncbi:hypothetical protein Q0N88_18690, partial [Bacillus thuringiensis]